MTLFPVPYDDETDLEENPGSQKLVNEQELLDSHLMVWSFLILSLSCMSNIAGVWPPSDLSDSARYSLLHPCRNHHLENGYPGV